MKTTFALLAALVASCHAAAITAPQCIPGPRAYNLRVCNVQCGIDRPGGDYGNAHTGTFEACVQACSADSKCVTAQYHEETGYCYFKNVRNPTVAGAGEDTVDCQQPNGFACSVPTDCNSLFCNASGKCASPLGF